MTDFNFNDAIDFVRNEGLGVNEEGERNALSVGGVIANIPYEMIPNATIRTTAIVINDVAFGTAYHASDGKFTVRDVFELVGGVVGGVGGAVLGAPFGGVGGVIAGAGGGIAGERFGGVLYDDLMGSSVLGLRATDIPEAPYNGNYSFASVSHGRQEDGTAANTRIGVDPRSGNLVAVETSVSWNNAKTGTHQDLLHGNVYDPTAVEVGYDLNGLDRLANVVDKLGNSQSQPNTPAGRNFQDVDSNAWRSGSSRQGEGEGSSGSISSSGSSSSSRTSAQESYSNSGGRGGYGTDDNDPRSGSSSSSSSSNSSSSNNPDADDPRGNGWWPVVLDLDGDGLEVDFSYDAAFDIDGDGYLEQTAWAAADDGFLVVDLEADGSISATGGDGDISQAEEVAFAAWAEAGATDLQALAEATDADGNLIFDSNGDGVLDANDGVWSSMKVFQDLDQDGEVDEGELKTLDEWGISQINLSYDDGSGFEETDDNITVFGNTLHGLASFVMNGEVIEGGVGDVSLAYNEFGWRQVETATGYTIEFERGEAWAFWDAESQTDADVDLASGGYTGAYGDDRNNILNAAAATSAVVIDGGAGADTITGGAGGDLLSGGAGADVIDGGAGDDVVFADAEDNVAAGNIQGSEGYDQLNMAVDAALNIADLGAIGFEAVEAGNEADNITGLDNDTNYYLSGNGGADTLTTARGNDILIGGEGDDSLSAGAGSDRLFGGAGNDTLDGGDDADFLAGGSGDDTLLGAGGNDVYFYQRSDGHDTIHDYAEGTYEVRSDYDAQYDYYESVQRGSGKNKSYVNELRTGFVATNQYVEMFGEIDGGIDTLKFGFGILIEDVLFNVTNGTALIQIRNLDDVDTAADESDSVSTEDSVTIVEWDDQKNRIENFEFADGTIIDMSQVIAGQTGHGEANDMQGTEEGDWLNSGGGNDTLSGNEGGDILLAGAGNDVLDGGAGKDFLFAGEGDDEARGGEGDDYILGGAGNDTVDGDAGDDTLSGDEGDDVLNGGDGNDILIGGRGADTLNGGLGDDTYIFFRGDGHDLIHDYGEGEVTRQETSQSWDSSYGKMGRWITETRNVTTVEQIDGGWDTLQFGYSILLSHIFFDRQGNNLVMGVREFDEEGNELSLDEMSDVVTVQDWTNEMSRVEELAFGDGLSIDISEFEDFQSGYGDDDNITGGSGHDLMTGGGGADTLAGNDGDDVLSGGSDDDQLSGGSGEDDLYGGSGNDRLKGGDGDDYLLGDAGDDDLEGGAGDDVLVGGRGDDLLKGGTGNDTYIFNRGDGHDTIDESQFDVGGGVVETGAGDFSAEEQEFTGWTGGKSPSSYTYMKNVWISDVRSGQIVTAIEGGDDVLQFGAYIDFSDLIVNTSGEGLSTDLVIELAPYLEGGEIVDSVTVLNQGTSEFEIETLRFANQFVLDIGSIDYAETGGDTDDVIDTASVALGTDQGAWLVGGGGDDTITGSASHDILVGSTGDDQLNGGLGNDTYVFGRGDGHDTILDAGSNAAQVGLSEMGGDAILFNAGITIDDLIFDYSDGTMDIYVGSQTNMTVPLADLADVISVENWNTAANRVELLQFYNNLDFNIGEIGATQLGADLTGAGSETPIDDVLGGTGLADWMDGFAGADVLNGNNGDDFMFGRDGDDVMNGGAGNDIMSGGANNDVMTGGSGNDVFTGGAGDDSLSGGAGEDVMFGGSGNDTLDGGAGRDLLVGDAGDDLYIASAGDDLIRFGFGDGDDTYRGSTSSGVNGTDIIAFEEGVSVSDLWFERVGHDLVVRLHGAEDTMTFESWYHGENASAYVHGFSAGSDFLRWQDVQGLVDAMDDHIADLNDGTTAYGILAGQTPESVQTAIDSAWNA